MFMYTVYILLTFDYNYLLHKSLIFLTQNLYMVILSYVLMYIKTFVEDKTTADI